MDRTGAPKAESVEAKAAEAEDIAGEVEAVLLRLYDRQERSYRSRKRLAAERFSRELAADLAMIAPGVERNALHERVLGIHDALTKALAEGDTGKVRTRTRKRGRLAKMLVVTLGLDARALKELGVPNEVIWQRVGFLPEEVDDAHGRGDRFFDLTRASRAGSPPAHQRVPGADAGAPACGWPTRRSGRTSRSTSLDAT